MPRRSLDEIFGATSESTSVPDAPKKRRSLDEIFAEEPKLPRGEEIYKGLGKAVQNKLAPTTKDSALSKTIKGIGSSFVGKATDSLAQGEQYKRALTSDEEMNLYKKQLRDRIAEDARNGRDVQELEKSYKKLENATLGLPPSKSDLHRQEREAFREAKTREERAALRAEKVERGGNAADLITGGLKGAASTVKNVSGILDKISPTAYAMEKMGLDRPEETIPEVIPEEAVTPKSDLEELGFGVEKIAEFFIPAGAATKAGNAVKSSKVLTNASKVIKEGAELLARAGTEATTMGGVAALQGGSVEDVGTTAAISGVLPIAGATLKPLKKFLTQKLPPKLVNTILKPSAKEFSFGKNPGAGVVKEGITGNTREGLLEAIKSKKQEVGQSIDKLLETQGKGKKVDVSELLGPIDAAMNRAVTSGEQALYSRLESIKDGLTKTFKLVKGKIQPSGERNLILTPKEAAALKREIGDAARWTGQAFDEDVNQVRVELYRELNNAIDDLVPGTKELNARYANLLSAEKSLDKTINTAEKQGLLGIKDLGVGVGLGGLYSLSQGNSTPEAIINSLLIAGGSKLAGTAAARTNIAKLLSKLSPQEKSILSNAVPVIRNVLSGINSIPEK